MICCVQILPKKSKGLAKFGRVVIYVTHDFGHKWLFDICNLFIGEFFIISENRTLAFSNSGIFVDGRKMRREQATQNLLNCELLCDIFVWQNSRKCILSRFADSVIIVGNF